MRAGIIIPVVAVVAVATGCLAGHFAAADGETFDWGTGGVVGGAVATLVLAVFTAILALSTRTLAEATKQLGDKRLAEDFEPPLRRLQTLLGLNLGYPRDAHVK